MRSNAASLEALVLVAAFATLIQFPFAAPIYFCYVAPLVLLAAIASCRAFGLATGVLPCAILLAPAVYGFRLLDHQSISTLGVQFRTDTQAVILDPDRASVRVTRREQREYALVRRLVDEHRLPGAPIFAGPDAPEIYFLTDSQNGTPALIDFLDKSRSTIGTRLTGFLEATSARRHSESRAAPVTGANHDNRLPDTDALPECASFGAVRGAMAERPVAHARAARGRSRRSLRLPTNKVPDGDTNQTRA